MSYSKSTNRQCRGRNRSLQGGNPNSKKLCSRFRTVRIFREPRAKTTRDAGPVLPPTATNVHTSLSLEDVREGAPTGRDRQQRRAVFGAQGTQEAEGAGTVGSGGRRGGNAREGDFSDTLDLNANTRPYLTCSIDSMFAPTHHSLPLVPHGQSDSDSEAIFDNVTAQEFDALARRRIQEDDFVVDDDGSGYVDNGEDEWGKKHAYGSSDEEESGDERGK